MVDRRVLDAGCTAGQARPGTASLGAVPDLRASAWCQLGGRGTALGASGVEIGVVAANAGTIAFGAGVAALAAAGTVAAGAIAVLGHCAYQGWS